MDENIDIHYQQLRYRQASDEPEKLITNAKKSLEAINLNHSSFASPRVKSQISDLSRKIDKMLKRSTLKFLNHIDLLLKSVNIKNPDITKEELLEKIDQIKKTVFDMEKEAKRKN